MIKSWIGWAAVVLAALVVLVPRPLWAAEESQEEKVLKSHGLKHAGDIFVLDTEARIKTKVREIRQLTRQLTNDQIRQQATLSPGEYQQALKGLGDQINQYRNQINSAQQQMNNLPKYRGRLATPYAMQQYQDLSAYSAQLQAEVYQESAYLNEIKSQPPDPKAKGKLDAQINDRREALQQAIKDLRELVDTAREKYAELAKNDEVQQVLQKLGVGAKTKPKLGPSHEFSTDVKLLEKMESDETSEPDAAVQPKHARPKRRTIREKRAAKPAAGAPAPASTPHPEGRS